ncbi:MAG TPA: XdhC/CoxI family protein [Luteitalea sp.]|nr:XdhC/CoxI family protein [Luteitalea sp.]
MTTRLFGVVDETIARGGAVALVTIVRAQGSTPQRVGARMLVFEDGHILGTIGGGCYEQDACGKARLALQTGRPLLAHYDLNDDFAEEQGLICGGQMDVFIDPIAPTPRVCIVGAGHVGYHTAQLAATVGFRVVVVDDRASFADPSRFPTAERVDVADIPEWLRTADIGPRDYLVIVTRGHREDLDAMRAALGRETAYLGLIGSRAKIARLYARLGEDGLDAARLAGIHAPIGLDLGAVSPEEIAVSIVAELIAHRRGRLGSLGEAADADAGRSARSMQWLPPSVR